MKVRAGIRPCRAITMVLARVVHRSGREWDKDTDRIEYGFKPAAPRIAVGRLKAHARGDIHGCDD